MVLLACSVTLYSQVIETNSFFWVQGGLGGFHEQKINELGGGAINLSLCFFNERIIDRKNSVRKANDLVEARFAGYFNNGDEHEMAWYYDIGLLYGKAAGDILRLYACAGIGLLGGTYYNVELVPYPIAGGKIYRTVSHNFSAFSVPLEAGISLNSPVIGIGFAGFANLNKTQPIIGIHLTLQVGRITKF
jgi:hypothetical protein